MKKVFTLLWNKKWGLAAAVIVLGFAAAGIASGKSNAASEAETAKVVSLKVAETVSASGALEADPFARLSWKASGVVETVSVKAGDKVRKGQVLLALQPESASANAAGAQADLVNAQKNLEDLLASDSELAQAIIDLDKAQRNYDDKAGYLRYLQTNQRLPLTDTFGWYERGAMGGWVYVSKTREYRGPATKEMIATAENNLELARAQLEDLQRKVERLKNKEQDILAAQARVEAAQATVNSLYIIAPFDGQALSVENRAGDTVNSGELSVNLADLSRLYVETQVDESDIASVKLGAPAEITLDAIPGVTFTGRVTIVNPVGEVVSGLVKYKVRVDLDKVEERMFLPLGATANVVIAVKEEAAALAVPITAIQNDSKGEYVWVVRNGAAERVDVSGGIIAGEFVVVSGDLKEGETLQIVNESGFRAPNPFGGSR